MSTMLGGYEVETVHRCHHPSGEYIVNHQRGLLQSRWKRLLETRPKRGGCPSSRRRGLLAHLDRHEHLDVAQFDLAMDQRADCMRCSAQRGAGTASGAGPFPLLT